MQTEKETTFALLLDFIDTDRVTRVYSGRPGCGCGCRGNYYDDQRNVRRVLTAMKANVDNAHRSGVMNGFGGEVIAFVETSTRYYWAYLNGAKGAA